MATGPAAVQTESESLRTPSRARGGRRGLFLHLTRPCASFRMPPSRARTFLRAPSFQTQTLRRKAQNSISLLGQNRPGPVLFTFPETGPTNSLATALTMPCAYFSPAAARNQGPEQGAVPAQAAGPRPAAAAHPIGPRGLGPRRAPGAVRHHPPRQCQGRRRLPPYLSTVPFPRRQVPHAHIAPRSTRTVPCRISLTPSHFYVYGGCVSESLKLPPLPCRF
jgi:hypothetical protein